MCFRVFSKVALKFISEDLSSVLLSKKTSPMKNIPLNFLHTPISTFTYSLYYLRPERYLLLSTSSHTNDGCLAHPAYVSCISCARLYKIMWSSLHLPTSTTCHCRCSVKYACEKRWQEICTISKVNVETGKNQWKQVRSVLAVLLLLFLPRSRH